MYTNRVFGTAKCVLFIEVSSFQGVLNERFHCIIIVLTISSTLRNLKTTMRESVLRQTKTQNSSQNLKLPGHSRY